MRFTSTSKIELGSTFTPVRCSARAARRCLLNCLISRQRARNSALSAKGSSALSCDRSFTHPSPMCWVMSSDSCGLHNTIQRRGVTPLVLLLNLRGHSS